MSERRCWCGARIYNGHHCEQGHLQVRGRRLVLLVLALALGVACVPTEPTCPLGPGGAPVDSITHRGDTTVCWWTLTCNLETGKCGPDD